MRAFGRGSVSSLLKVILDVIHIVLWVALAVCAVGAVAALVLSFRPDLFPRRMDLGAVNVRGPWLGPAAAALFLLVAAYLAGGVVVVTRLRAIFETLIAGDPFRPQNAGRLRVIGGALAVLELGRYVVSALARAMFHGAVHIGGGVSLTTWFAVLVIFVLAEVFREGARLRGEAELTI